MKITPENVRAGADRISAENTTVTGVDVPDATAAMAGLTGFKTAATLADAHDATKSSFKVVGGRYERMAQLCRDTANTFELADLIAPGLVSASPWMSKKIGDGLTAMGDLNRTTPGP
ncbi:hypothetical protein BKN37_07015 [Mycobacterium talmoniae]|uniref:Uncharacterized protein n=1 Tax=Mycobacterium talmoniae TaxID=1858794 RepID=A0A1S1NQM0_9MYCO|nr:hypothetical protein BKN37_07015 [Mycobacterium talmoniae]